MDMFEHTCGVAFDATVPEVALDMSWYCAVRQVVVFPVVAQRQIPIVFWIQSPYVLWSMSLLCSCSPSHRSLTCPSVCNDRCRVIRSAEYCGSSTDAVLRSPLTSLSWRRGCFPWSRRPWKFPSRSWTRWSISLCSWWCEFHRCRRGEDSRALTVALVEKLVTFPDFWEFVHCMRQLIDGVMS